MKNTTLPPAFIILPPHKSILKYINNSSNKQYKIKIQYNTIHSLSQTINHIRSDQIKNTSLFTGIQPQPSMAKNPPLSSSNNPYHNPYSSTTNSLYSHPQEFIPKQLFRNPARSSRLLTINSQDLFLPTGKKRTHRFL
jgi:hypothetical protein